MIVCLRRRGSQLPCEVSALHLDFGGGHPIQRQNVEPAGDAEGKVHAEQPILIGYGLAFPGSSGLVAVHLHGGLGNRRAGFARDTSQQVASQVTRSRDLKALGRLKDVRQGLGVVIDLQFPESNDVGHAQLGRGHFGEGEHHRSARRSHRLYVPEAALARIERRVPHLAGERDVLVPRRVVVADHDATKGLRLLPLHREPGVPVLGTPPRVETAVNRLLRHHVG